MKVIQVISAPNKGNENIVVWHDGNLYMHFSKMRELLPVMDDDDFMMEILESNFRQLDFEAMFKIFEQSVKEDMVCSYLWEIHIRIESEHSDDVEMRRHSANILSCIEKGVNTSKDMKNYMKSLADMKGYMKKRNAKIEADEDDEELLENSYIYLPAMSILIALFNTMLILFLIYKIL